MFTLSYSNGSHSDTVTTSESAVRDLLTIAQRAGILFSVRDEDGRDVTHRFN